MKKGKGGGKLVLTSPLMPTCLPMGCPHHIIVCPPKTAPPEGNIDMPAAARNGPPSLGHAPVGATTHYAQLRVKSKFPPKPEAYTPPKEAPQMRPGENCQIYETCFILRLATNCDGTASSAAHNAVP